MKLILENWRNYREDTLLVEEIEILFNQLEQQLLNEISVRGAQGIMDSLSDAWEKVKTSAGAAKDKALEIYNNTMEKINDWILRVSMRIHDMAKSAVGGALNLLLSVVRKVAAFCGKHATLCKIILTIIIALAVYAVLSYMFAGEAKADVIVRGQKLTQEELDAFETIAYEGYKNFGEDGAKLAATLREMHMEPETYTLDGARGLSGHVESLISAIRKKKGEDPEYYNKLVELGQNIHAEIRTLVENTTTRFQSSDIDTPEVIKKVSKEIDVGRWYKGQ